MGGPAAGVLAAVGLYAVPAEAATTRVPCDPATLATAVASAASGQTLSLAGHCIYQLTAALPTVSQNLTILGNDATLQRSYAQATPAFTILSADGGTLAVTDLNFSNGSGALAATGNASLTVQGGQFANNHAANGGAINSTTGAGSLAVTGATFTANSATADGGAIYTNEAVALTTVTDSTFTKNTAGQIGGAIYNFFDTNITGSTFDTNQAQDGGAIFNNAFDGDSLADVTLDGNRATQDGGAVYTYSCYLNISKSQISGNHAGNNGGAIYQSSLNVYPDGLTLTSTSLRDNTAQNGGGIYDDNTVTNLTSNSTISGNTATADGGGIYNNGEVLAFGNLNLNTAMITDNTADAYGGGIYNTQGTLAATSTAVEHNTAQTGGGGIYDGTGPNTVTLTSSPVLYNHPDNCEPPGTITGCGSGAEGRRVPTTTHDRDEAVRRHVAVRLATNGSLVPG
jgi:predicted outer membrane repeat protein